MLIQDKTAATGVALPGGPYLAVAKLRITSTKHRATDRAARLPTYPRPQRIAWLVVLTGATLLTPALRLRPYPEPNAELLALAGDLRAAEVSRAAEYFRPAPEAFAFNPNTVTDDELQRLGLSKKQAASWLKFRGGRTNAFRKPADIGKLFVLSDDDKARLIPLAYVTEGAAKGAGPRVRGFAFDPDVVTPADLRRLGLSEKQARAFVRYRESARYGRMFRKPEDIRKIRTLSDAQKDHLVAYAVIAPEPKKEVLPRQRFAFDPNTVTEDSLVLLGFPRWQVASFGKYRGGRTGTFRRPTDLRRVGALDSALVEELIPYVTIAPITSPAPAAPPAEPSADTAPSTYGFVPKAPPPAPASFNVNAGNVTAWRTLPGIGKYRAGRIVEHRNKYGGFYTLEQLAATPDLPDSTFRQILPYLTVGPVFRKLPVNRATFDELRAHPNIKRSLANVIVKNREKFGRFDGPEDLRRIRLITKENFPTILPYLSFE